MNRHRHEWTGLWGQMGPYAPQPSHVHQCFDHDCDAMLVGPGEQCDGKRATHEVRR
jgi:hypothetical protein